jgi:hypothetical protein
MHGCVFRRFSTTKLYSSQTLSLVENFQFEVGRTGKILAQKISIWSISVSVYAVFKCHCMALRVGETFFEVVFKLFAVIL